MTNPTWTWADLTPEQQQLLADAEQSLGADYLLAFEPISASPKDGGEPIRGIKTANLTESQLECLNGLEAQLGSVIVAYRRNDT
jgi:hypothetical protein